MKAWIAHYKHLEPAPKPLCLKEFVPLSLPNLLHSNPENSEWFRQSTNHTVPVAPSAAQILPRNITAPLWSPYVPVAQSVSNDALLSHTAAPPFGVDPPHYGPVPLIYPPLQEIGHYHNSNSGFVPAPGLLVTAPVAGTPTRTSRTFPLRFHPYTIGGARSNRPTTSRQVVQY